MINSIFKNNAKSPFEINELEVGFSVLTCKNETDSTKVLKEDITNDVIQFHFCAKGLVKFNFYSSHYVRELKEEKALLLYNPKNTLAIDLEVLPKSWTVSLLISIEKFHRFFSEDASYIDFLKEGKREKKYYQEQTISPVMAVVLSQMLTYNLHPSVMMVYLKGKAYELLSLYFNKPEEIDVEQCPFLVDEENVLKIKKAKEIIIERLVDPPNLQQLSNEIGLSLKKLKEGFKEVYGDTVYGFLVTYKLEYARNLLETGDYNVNEVALKIGYSTASHFISAFKKKFGTTPKKYISALKS